MRKAVADWFVLIDDMQTEANSHSIVAHRLANGRLSLNQFNELNKAMTPFLDSIGFSPKPEDSEENLHVLQDFIERLGNILPEDVGLKGFTLSDDLSNDSKRLLDLLDPSVLEEAKESNLLNESTTNSEDRPYQVAAGRAARGIRRRLAHTLRDSQHMKTFVLHNKEIDLLQVERAQFNLINTTNPPHRLVELGLSNRCFTAATIEESVQIIEATVLMSS